MRSGRSVNREDMCTLMVTEIKLPYFGYWDGPLSGLCIYEGKICFYNCFSLGGWLVAEGYDDDDDSWSKSCCTPRMYRVYSLSMFQRFIFMSNRWIQRNIIFKLPVKHNVYRFWWRKIEPEIMKTLKKNLVGAFSENEYWVDWRNDKNR